MARAGSVTRRSSSSSLSAKVGPPIACTLVPRAGARMCSSVGRWGGPENNLLDAREGPGLAEPQALASHRWEARRPAHNVRPSLTASRHAGATARELQALGLYARARPPC